MLSQIAIEQEMQYEKIGQTLNIDKPFWNARQLKSWCLIRVFVLLGCSTTYVALKLPAPSTDLMTTNGVDGIGMLIECIGEYEQMEGEATRLADKVNVLQGYIASISNEINF